MVHSLRLLGRRQRRRLERNRLEPVQLPQDRRAELRSGDGQVHCNGLDDRLHSRRPKQRRCRCQRQRGEPIYPGGLGATDLPARSSVSILHIYGPCLAVGTTFRPGSASNPAGPFIPQPWRPRCNGKTFARLRCERYSCFIRPRSALRNLARCVHPFEQQTSQLIIACFQSGHAADGEMCDRRKHPRQSFRYPPMCGLNGK